MRTLLATTVLATAGAAAAQPTGNPPVPTADPSRRPTSPAPAEPTPAPQPATGGIQVIQLGPDGKPIVTPSEDTGFFYDDEAGQYYDEPQTIRYGPTPELHVVRGGDTLWDICWYYFNDPWQWPKVWSYNAQVTNPHWIYPGDLIRLLPRGTFVSDAGTGEPDTNPDTNPTPDPVPAPQRRFTVRLRQTAFVEQSELQKSMKIDGSVDAKELLTTGDVVYVSYPEGKPPKVGKSYSIYLSDNEVAGAGSYVRILGQLKITAVKKDKRATAEITDANYEIERGALVGPLIREYKTVPPSPAKVDLVGNIIAMLTRDQLVGEGEVVFIDVGEKSGIEVGNRMYVVRHGDALEPVSGPATTVGQNDLRFPERALGEVVVVEVGPKMSIGLITLSVQEMGIGDQVVMRRPRSSTTTTEPAPEK
jgi:hypothetical protein